MGKYLSVDSFGNVLCESEERDAGSRFQISIAEDGFEITKESIGVSRRIGVESSGDAALKPFRFYVKGNRFVSSYPNK